MRSARRITGWSAAAVAAVLVTTASPATALVVEEPVAAVSETPSAAPVESAPAEPTASASDSIEPIVSAADDVVESARQLAEADAEEGEVAAAAVGFGDVALTFFDDRFADGIFDDTKVARNGDRDSRRDAARLLDVNGAWHFANDDDKDGVLLFEDVPAGTAQVHVVYPQGPGWNAFFDATGATSAADSDRLLDGNYMGTPTAYLEVTVGEATAEPVIGLTGLRTVAEVKMPDGSPAVGLNVDFGSHGQWFRGTEYGAIDNAPIGTYEAFSTTGGPYQIHLPGELGVRLTVPGYSISTVTAISGGGNVTDTIPVRREGNTSWISSLDAASFGQNPTFTIQLAALPTADLQITEFDDRYADGIFDDTLGSGEKVDSQSRRLSHIVTLQGIAMYPGVNDQGDYLFEDVPLGEATAYFTYPNSALEDVFFDATGAETADDITPIDNDSAGAYARAAAPVDVVAGGSELLVGFTSLKAKADVDYEDGTPASGVTVELGSGAGWRAATEYANEAFKGQYEVLNGTYGAAHLPDEIGVRVTAPAGYEIGEVEAFSSRSSAELDIVERDGAYWVKSTALAVYSDRVDFAVTLEEAPTATVTVNYFGDVLLNGVFDATIDLPLAAAQLYLEDGDGEWWATTARDGVFTFEGVAPGVVTVYAQIPENEMTDLPGLEGLELPEGALSLWDATNRPFYGSITPLETETLSFEDGSLYDPVTKTTVPFDLEDQLVGVLPLGAVEDDATLAREIGSATVIQVATAFDPISQELATNVGIEFWANGPVAGEQIEDGTFVPQRDGEVAIAGAAEYGVNVTAPAGYEVVEVTAIDLAAGEEVEVTQPAALPTTGRMALLAAAPAQYRVAPQELTGPAAALVWAVQIAPIDPTDPVVPTLPESGESIDLPPTAPQPAAAPGGRLAATGLAFDAWMLLSAAGALIAAGLTARVVLRRRHS